MAATAEEIVRALAGVDRDSIIVDEYGTCSLCERSGREHAADCPYGMAIEWVASAELEADETRPTACTRCKCAGTVTASRAAQWKCQVEGCGGQMVRTNGPVLSASPTEAP